MIKNILLNRHTDLSIKEKISYIVPMLCCSLLMALGGRMSFILPLSPVPVTLQPLALIISCFLWGKKIAVAGVLAYYAQGLMGLPVFSLGTSGIWPFLSPTGGYLLGFLPAAYIIGMCADLGWGKNPLLAGLAVLLGKVMIYSCGLFFLAQILPSQQLLNAGLYPFLPAALFQVACTAILVPTIMTMSKKKSQKK
ncbi:MAG: biotin transporter BioY [Spirochaetia bacterium]